MKWTYWILGTFLYFYQFIFRSLFGTLGDEVTVDFHLSVTELSTFLSSAMLSYALVQIPAGMLIDHFGPRKMLSLAMFVLSAGVMIISVTDSFPLAIFGRVLMGIGSAFGFLGTSQMVAVWFPQYLMPSLLGGTVVIGALGGAFSNQIFSQLTVGQWDWRTALFWMSAVGLLSVALFVFFLKDGRSSAVKPKRTVSVFTELKQLCTNQQVLVASAFAFFAYMPISVIADSWGVAGFEKIFAVGKEEAAKTLAYFYIPFSLGNFFYSNLATVSRNSRAVLFLAFSLSLASLVVLLLMPEVGRSSMFGISGFLLLTSVVAFNLGGVTLVYAVGCSQVPTTLAATTVGVINMFSMISGGLYAKMMGWVLHSNWDGATTPEGLPLYSGLAYQKAFQPLVFSIVLALVLVVIMRQRTYTAPS
jgi:MFS family permease